MATTTMHQPAYALHPVHVVLLISTLPLFLGALLSDLAYGSSYQIQWKNFASWLIVGGLVFAGLALLWSIVDALRADIRRGVRRWLLPLLIIATFIVGFVNALVHAEDAWSGMPTGTLLSFLTLVLALAAIWIGLSRRRVQP